MKIVFCLFFILNTLSGIAQTSSLNGTVRDNDSTLSDVKVWIDGELCDSPTPDSGLFRGQYKDSQIVTLKAYKKGYFLFTDPNRTVGNKGNLGDVTLEKAILNIQIFDSEDSNIWIEGANVSYTYQGNGAPIKFEGGENGSYYANLPASLSADTELSISISKDGYDLLPTTYTISVEKEKKWFSGITAIKKPDTIPVFLLKKK